MKSLGAVRVELRRIEANWEPKIEEDEGADDAKLKMRRKPVANTIFQFRSQSKWLETTYLFAPETISKTLVKPCRGGRMIFVDPLLLESSRSWVIR